MWIADTLRDTEMVAPLHYCTAPNPLESLGVLGELNLSETR